MSKHHHEGWQLQDRADGGQYCAACGDVVTVIPAQAVEAAAKATYEHANPDSPWDEAAPDWKAAYTASVIAGLEAAAPHMLATAWEQGHLAGSAGKVLEDEYPHLELTRNPYRPAP